MNSFIGRWIASLILMSWMFLFVFAVRTCLVAFGWWLTPNPHCKLSLWYADFVFHLIWFVILAIEINNGQCIPARIIANASQHSFGLPLSSNTLTSSIGFPVCQNFLRTAQLPTHPICPKIHVTDEKGGPHMTYDLKTFHLRNCWSVWLITVVKPLSVVISY